MDSKACAGDPEKWIKALESSHAYIGGLSAVRPEIGRQGCRPRRDHRSLPAHDLCAYQLEVLARQFTLTASEIRVQDAVLRVSSVTAIAEMLGSSQSELVKLVAGFRA